MATNELVQPVVKSKLRRLQSALRARLAGEGTAWILLAVVAAVLATLALDWLLRLPKEVRIGLAAIVLAGIGYVVFRYMLRPLAVKMDSDNLALLVEKRHGTLGDRLISALQFDRQDPSDRLNVSEAMIERLSCEANDLAGAMDFNDVVERRGMVRMLMSACCAIVLLAGFSVWQQDLMSIWFQRNVMFMATPYPQDTYLDVQGGPDFYPLRGDDLRVLVYARHGGKAPEEVLFNARFKDTPEAMIKAPKVDDPALFFPVFCDKCEQATPFNISQCGQTITCQKSVKGKPCGNVIKLPAGVYANNFPVQDSFEFYVTGGDDRLDKDNPHRVLAIDPPGVSTVRFTVVYDAYQNEPDRTFDGSSGVIQAKVGSSIMVVAEANKDIALDGATLQVDDGKKEPMQVSMMKLDGKDVPRMLRGKIFLGSENKEAAKQLKISLTDSEGHRNRLATPYLIQYRPDEKPNPKLKPRNIGARVTARVVLPLILNITDDSGLEHVECLRGSASTKEGATTRPAFAPILVADRLSGREYNTTWSLDTESMKLVPGDNLTVAIRAYDNMPKELGGPNSNTSGTMTFAVVTDGELIDEINLRLVTIRSEYDPVINTNTDSIANIEAAKVAMKESVTPAVRNYLANAAQQVGSISSICSKTLVAVTAVHDEMASNKIIPAEDPLQQAIDKLTQLQDTLPSLQADINRAAGGSDVGTLTSNCDSIMERQHQIHTTLNEISSLIKRGHDIGEIMSQWQKLIEMSKELQKYFDTEANKDSDINQSGSGVK